MSLCIIIGVGIGCWALLSIVSSERYRLQQQVEAERHANERSLEQAENAEA